MKKLLQLLCLISFIIVFASCSTEKINTDGLTNDFNSDISFTYKGNEFSGQLTRAVEGVSKITLNSPDELNGVTLKSDGEALTVAYEDMVIDLTDEGPLSTSFAALVFRILDNTSNIENVSVLSADDSSVITGTIEEGKYKIILSTDGKIQKIILESAALESNLSKFEFNN